MLRKADLELGRSVPHRGGLRDGAHSRAVNVCAFSQDRARTQLGQTTFWLMLRSVGARNPLASPIYLFTAACVVC